MSGICGIINLDGAPVEEQAVRRMIDVISHRGPDGSDVHVDLSGK